MGITNQKYKWIISAECFTKIRILSKFNKTKRDKVHSIIGRVLIKIWQYYQTAKVRELKVTEHSDKQAK